MVEKAKDDREFDEFTYYPEEGGPAKVVWNGIEFKANVAVKVSRKTTIQVLQKMERTLESGEVVTRSVERRIPMVELARTNYQFGINGEPPIEKIDAVGRPPQTSDEYRSYAVRWIGETTSATEIDVRWKAEQAMRESLGVDDRDVARIMPFLQAQRDMHNGTVRAA